MVRIQHISCPNLFQQFIAIIRGSCLPQKLLRQYLCCGCVWITICPVWPTLYLTTGHTVQIVIHILVHPQHRYCLSSYWGKYDPLILAINCWNMLGWNLKYINKSYNYLDAFVGYVIIISFSVYYNHVLTELVFYLHRWNIIFNSKQYRPIHGTLSPT
jgi:hypothetical protein